MLLVKIFGDNWNESPFLYLMVTRWIIEIGKQFPRHVLTNRQQLQNLNYCHYNNTWQGKHWILLKSWTFCSFMFDDGLVLVVKVKVGSVLVTRSITGKQYLGSNYLAVRCRGRGGWMGRKTWRRFSNWRWRNFLQKLFFPVVSLLYHGFLYKWLFNLRCFSQLFFLNLMLNNTAINRWLTCGFKLLQLLQLWTPNMLIIIVIIKISILGQ